MKNVFLILFVAVLLAACKKSDLPGDNGCISQVKRINFDIKSSDSVTAIALLEQNGIAHSDLQLSFVALDTVKTGPNTGIYQNVFTDQFINGLPVLSGHIWYQFKNNVLESTTGQRYNSSSLSGGSSLSLSQLRELFLKATAKNNAAVSFKDSCLVAQFGYYDLNAVSGGAPHLVKAWSVTLRNYNAYPRAFFQDDSGATILYDDGPVLYNTSHLKR
ncbi:MAG TPA: hypothetical protein VFE54_14925 [Mucilaginibacter sp.]|jgi:hypothetical protein|nr:hypothetical protein [Mucilaginibacter sp.]